MTQPQAKPVKKRRRWLIVAFVLVLVSTVSWWYWPRGDARFVGKWELVLPNAPQIKQVWRLSRSGRIEISSGGKVTAQWKWVVDRDEMRLEETSPYKGVIATSELQFVQQEFMRLVDRLIGRSVAANVRSYRIVDYSPNALTLQRHDPQREGRTFAPLSLTRIPE